MAATNLNLLRSLMARRLVADVYAVADTVKALAYVHTVQIAPARGSKVVGLEMSIWLRGADSPVVVEVYAGAPRSEILEAAMGVVVSSASQLLAAQDQSAYQGESPDV